MVAVPVIAAETDTSARRLFTTPQQRFLRLIRNQPVELLPPVDSLDAIDPPWNAFEQAAVESRLSAAIVGSEDTVKADAWEKPGGQNRRRRNHRRHRHLGPRGSPGFLSSTGKSCRIHRDENTRNYKSNPAKRIASWQSQLTRHRIHSSSANLTTQGIATPLVISALTGLDRNRKKTGHLTRFKFNFGSSVTHDGHWVHAQRAERGKGARN